MNNIHCITGVLKMEGNDSCPITPPHSPVVQHENDDDMPEEEPMDIDNLGSDTPLIFCCGGEIKGGTQRISEMINAMVNRLLQRKITVEKAAPTVELNQCFYITRQKYDMLDDMNKDMFSVPKSGLSASCLKIRENIKIFFDNLLDYLMSITGESGNEIEEFITHLVSHLHGFHLYIQRFTNLPAKVMAMAASRHGNQTASVAFHMFHLHLEIAWSMAEVLHILTTYWPNECARSGIQWCNGEDNLQPDVFTQYTTVLLYDFLQLAVHRHNNLTRISPTTYTQVTPFHCTCSCQLQHELMQLIFHRHHTSAKQTFWAIVTPMMQRLVNSSNHSAETPALCPDQDTVVPPTVSNALAASNHAWRLMIREFPRSLTPLSVNPPGLDCSIFDAIPTIECTDAIGFCWWGLAHMAPFNSQLSTATSQNSLGKKTISNNWHFVTSLLKRCLAVPEVKLRTYLHCLQTLSQTWDAHLPVITLLWDMYYKRLNEGFQASGGSLVGYATIISSPLFLYEKSCHIVCGEGIGGQEEDTSYVLFLRLLAIHLKKSEDNGWKQLKGRLYAKFQARRLQELTDNGLQNLALLFLVAGQVAPLQEVGAKLCELYAMLPRLESRRQCATWRGSLALALHYVHSEAAIGFLADRLSQDFNSLAKEFANVGNDQSEYTELWKSVHVYLDGLQEILEASSSLNLQQHRLIGAGIADVLASSHENELRYTLSCLQSVLTTSRILQKRSVPTSCSSSYTQGVADRLWQYVYPFVKKHVTTQTPPHQLADLAAGFCLLAIDSPAPKQAGLQIDVITCFQCFVCGDNVSPQVSCSVLCHLLPHTAVMGMLSQQLVDYEVKVVRAWFRAHWFLPTSTSALKDLTVQMGSIGLLRELCTVAGRDLWANAAGAANPVVGFVRAIGAHYDNIQDFSERLSFRDKALSCIGDLGLWAAMLLKTCASSDILRAAFQLAGKLVKYCTPLLYIKSKPDCLLPQLVDRLLLPRSLLTNKPLPTHVLVAVRGSLHLFIQGLGRLSFSQDPYIQRRLKEIISHYLTRFPMKSTAISGQPTYHPFVLALRESSSQFTKFFLDLARKESSPNAKTACTALLQALHRETEAGQVRMDQL